MAKSDRRSLSRLLVANRAEIAARVIRSARRCSIATVAVYSEPDAALPYVALADSAVALAGSTPAETYLNVGALIEAAAKSGADAVHPGYGFLSERAEFAAACRQAGLTFVGPSPEVIEAMGSKVHAKARLAEAGVPVLEGAEVASADDVVAAGRRIGWPLLIKATYGGGGRGMRVVRDDAGAAEAVEAARSEAAGAFGDPSLFVERYIDDPRHVEVQILGDAYGRVVDLFERECSIQRRHQKIIEESPSPAVDGELRRRLGDCARRAGAAIGYQGAGTVEFVLDGAGQFFFLEMNTRLQVEHPVTEALTGLDLVALQLAIAAGEPLPEEAARARAEGHAVEARLYAEDVAAGFLPASGRMELVEFPEIEGVRVDLGIASGSVISTHYDSMIAKVIAHGPSRTAAIERLIGALAGARLHGPPTNRDLLVGVLDHPDFAGGRTDTGFLVRHDPVTLAAGRRRPEVLRLHAAAAALAGRATRDEAARRRGGPAAVHPGIPTGWRNVGPPEQSVVLVADGTPVTVRARGGSPPAVAVDGVDLGALVVHRAEPASVELAVDGVRRRYRVARYGERWWVDSELGSYSFIEEDRFPEAAPTPPAGSLVAPMPGLVARVAVRPGDRVEAGTVLVVMEAMKMEHAVAAPGPGQVREILVRPGEQVGAGTVLAVVDGPE
jgi:acetyl/propionyl-CoA carboxylase alpha subunit